MLKTSIGMGCHCNGVPGRRTKMQNWQRHKYFRVKTHNQIHRPYTSSCLLTPHLFFFLCNANSIFLLGSILLQIFPLVAHSSAPPHSLQFSSPSLSCLSSFSSFSSPMVVMALLPCVGRKGKAPLKPAPLTGKTPRPALIERSEFKMMVEGNRQQITH